MRHTRAAHALQAGGELTTVLDNLRHASLATTSMYLHSDDTRPLGGNFRRLGRGTPVSDRFERGSHTRLQIRIQIAHLPIFSYDSTL
jgi:hypothetical protein